jgi:Tfp pilus assembly protein PilF
MYAADLDAEVQASMRATIASVGFSSHPAALTADLLAKMSAEAEAQLASAWGRAEGETVAHCNRRADLGPVARDFLTAPETLQLLEALVGAPVVPSFEASCYTYYEGPDDFLAPHLDRPDACTYTLIVYLQVLWPPGDDPSPGLELQVFASETAKVPQARLPTRPNVLVVGRGAQVWHGRPRLRAGEQVVALTACYAVAADSVDIEARTAVLLEEGFAEYEQGQWQAARERFESALELDPTSAEAWSGLGFVEWSAGEHAEALHRYRTAARYDANNASIWSNIGLCLRDLEAFDQAANAFAVALMLDPGYAPALNEWGNVLQDHGRVAESIEFYLRSLALDPSRAVVHHNLGVAYTRQNEPLLAIQAFNAALDRDPAYSHSLEELGLLCAAGGLLDPARDYLVRAGTPRAKAILESLIGGRQQPVR